MVVYGAAQFLVVLDQAVMNVSISQLVDDFDTTVTVIQAVITLYALVMAMLMLTGGKLGDLLGRRRAFGLGMAIYGLGSALTAVSWSVLTLGLGWSILEGIGAALVLPAMVALVASTYEGRDRVLAFALLGGVAGVSIAVGPVLGGWLTTELTWRLVFVGEVVVTIGVLLALRVLPEDAPRSGASKPLDWVGSSLSALGLGIIVLGTLNASVWGWIEPKASPIEPFGFALTPFVIGAGALALVGFGAWGRRRARLGQSRLVRLELLSIPPLRAGLQGFLTQNIVLLGTFFVVPLYLQLVQGLDALETGLRMVPVSMAMLLTSLGGSVLTRWLSPRAIVRGGFAVLAAALAALIGAIEPTLDGWAFGTAMAALGVGMGLIASQLANVIQSAVDQADRSEAGGLQWTAQQLGGSLGVAVIGAIVLSALAGNVIDLVEDDARLAPQVREQVTTQVSEGLDFVTIEQVSDAGQGAGLDATSVAALTEDYAEAQLFALKAGLLAALGLALLALVLTRDLPLGTST